jgi:endonuclease/exonuclease/phosphatase family metal-dependent hydrolase
MARADIRLEAANNGVPDDLGAGKLEVLSRDSDAEGDEAPDLTRQPTTRTTPRWQTVLRSLSPQWAANAFVFFAGFSLHTQLLTALYGVARSDGNFREAAGLSTMSAMSPLLLVLFCARRVFPSASLAAAARVRRGGPLVLLAGVAVIFFRFVMLKAVAGLHWQLALSNLGVAFFYLWLAMQLAMLSYELPLADTAKVDNALAVTRGLAVAALAAIFFRTLDGAGTLDATDPERHGRSHSGHWAGGVFYLVSIVATLQLLALVLVPPVDPPLSRRGARGAGRAGSSVAAAAHGGMGSKRGATAHRRNSTGIAERNKLAAAAESEAVNSVRTLALCVFTMAALALVTWVLVRPGFLVRVSASDNEEALVPAVAVMAAVAVAGWLASTLFLDSRNPAPSARNVRVCVASPYLLSPLLLLLLFIFLVIPHAAQQPVSRSGAEIVFRTGGQLTCIFLGLLLGVPLLFYGVQCAVHAVIVIRAPSNAIFVGVALGSFLAWLIALMLAGVANFVALPASMEGFLRGNAWLFFLFLALLCSLPLAAAHLPSGVHRWTTRVLPPSALKRWVSVVALGCVLIAVIASASVNAQRELPDGFTGASLATPVAGVDVLTQPSNDLQRVSALRAAVYAVNSGLDRGGRLAWNEIASELQILRADLLALIDGDTARVETGGGSLAHYLGARLGMPYLHQGAQTNAGSRGVALLSRRPLRAVRAWYLPAEGFTATRVAIDAFVPAAGGVEYHVVAADASAERIEQQAGFLRALLGEATPTRALVLGSLDVDARDPRLAPLAPLEDAFVRAYPSGRDTANYTGWSDADTQRRVDLALVSTDVTVSAVSCLRHEQCAVCAEAGRNADACRSCSPLPHLLCFADIFLGDL